MLVRFRLKEQIGVRVLPFASLKGQKDKPEQITATAGPLRG
jgi:hypothetical protein